MRDAYARECGRCFYCERPCFIRRHKLHLSDDATVDHIIPKSKGGADDIGNVVLACARCNAIRGTVDASFFLLTGTGERKRAKFACAKQQQAIGLPIQ